MKRLLLMSIIVYQRFLSPIKGFSCAHRVNVGGKSCSAYGYYVIDRFGTNIGTRLIKRRLKKCSQQHLLQNEIRTRRAPSHGKLHLQAGFCDASCDGCDVGGLGFDGCDIIGNACNILDGCGSCDFSGWSRSKNDTEEKWVTIEPNSK